MGRRELVTGLQRHRAQRERHGAADHRLDAVRRRRVPERRRDRQRRLPARLRPGHRDSAARRSRRRLRPFSGSVYALAADANGVLYAGGGFTNLEDIDSADNVAYFDGSVWHGMGTGGGGTCLCAVSDFVRSLTTAGTDVYVGTDALERRRHPPGRPHRPVGRVGLVRARLEQCRHRRLVPANGLPERPDHLLRPPSSPPAHFLNANGDPRADNIAYFDGQYW